MPEMEYALAVLSELLNRFPDNPALKRAIETMDMPDELWIALKVMTLQSANRNKLRDFLLVHQNPAIVRADERTLMLVGEGR